MQTQGSYQAEEQKHQKEKSPANEGASANCIAEREKRDLNLFEQSPGLISDSNKMTGKLCKVGRGRVRRGEGSEADRQTHRDEREANNLHNRPLRRNLVDRFLCV